MRTDSVNPYQSPVETEPAEPFGYTVWRALVFLGHGLEVLGSLVILLVLWPATLTMWYADRWYYQLTAWLYHKKWYVWCARWQFRVGCWMMMLAFGLGMLLSMIWIALSCVLVGVAAYEVKHVYDLWTQVW